ncbi:MAG: hypothetical protein GF381_00290 [Candidatus Pacebacteria bacterium]|nr:hypothetical protein [Candidatus Paceibacterota bacterium]
MSATPAKLRQMLRSSFYLACFLAFFYFLAVKVQLVTVAPNWRSGVVASPSIIEQEKSLVIFHQIDRPRLFSVIIGGVLWIVFGLWLYEKQEK